MRWVDWSILFRNLSIILKGFSFCRSIAIVHVHTVKYLKPDRCEDIVEIIYASPKCWQQESKIGSSSALFPPSPSPSPRRSWNFVLNLMLTPEIDDDNATAQPHSIFDDVTTPTEDSHLYLPCTHTSCNQPFFSWDAKSFRYMTITQRLSVVCCILYVTRAAEESETVNELAGGLAYYHNFRQRRYLNATEDPGIQTRESFLYSMREQKLCREAFATLTGLIVHTVTRHGTDVTTSTAILKYVTSHNQSHMEKLGLHCQMVDRFLNYVSDTFAL